MFKRKAAIISAVIMLVIAELAISCAPVAETSRQTPATQSPTANTTAASSTAPATPASPLPPAVPATKPAETTPVTQTKIVTSFEAETYVNSQPGFIVKYPRNWTRIEASGNAVFNNAVFSIADSSSLTADSLSICIIAETKDFANAAKAVVEASGAFNQYGAKANIESQKTTTLADGKTVAYEAVLSSKIMIQSFYFYCFGVNSGGKTIAIIGYTLKNDEKSKQLLQEIAKTLTLK